jgi:hypothetical protein
MNNMLTSVSMYGKKNQIKFVGLLILILMLSACGGGASTTTAATGDNISSAPSVGSTGSTANTVNTGTPSGMGSTGGTSGTGIAGSTPSLAGAGAGSSLITSPMGCGTVTSTGTGNSTPIVVDGFPCAVAGGVGIVNVPQRPYISVKICAPNSTTNCQIVDHVLLDTGSTGLRIASSALLPNLQPGATGLPLVAGSNSAVTLAECETYVDSYVYGPLVNVDVYIAGESAKNTTMQVFGSSGFVVPPGCSSVGGTETNTVQTFGANGLMGVNLDTLDAALFFDCQSASVGSCVPNSAYAGMPNIVTKFASDNNGVVISLPAIDASGATNVVSGTLLFGVSTQTNNTPVWPTLTLITVNNTDNYNFGSFSAQIGGNWYSAYLDSGTEQIYFNDTGDAGLVPCSTDAVSIYAGLYCPTGAQSLSFNVTDYGSKSILGILPVSIVNPANLNSNAIAYNNLGGPISSSSTLDQEIALGLATFFGHTNYFLFNGYTVPSTGFFPPVSYNASGPATGPIIGIQFK